jgi:hypothetical protein
VQVATQAAAFLFGRGHQVLAGPADIHGQDDRVPGRGDLADDPVQQPGLVRPVGRPSGRRTDGSLRNWPTSGGCGKAANGAGCPV